MSSEVEFDLYEDPLEDEYGLVEVQREEDVREQPLFTAVSRSVSVEDQVALTPLSMTTSELLYRSVDTGLSATVEAVFEQEEEDITMPADFSLTIPDAFAVNRPSSHTVSRSPRELLHADHH